MKDNIDPKWAWFWESKPTVALPLWEDSGKPRNYGYGLPELEFCETMPSWSFGPRGYGVESTGFAAASIPSATSEVLRFNYDTNPRSGSISSGSRQAAFIGTTMFTDDEVSFRNPNGASNLQLAAYGDSTIYSAPYRDSIKFIYATGGPQHWRINYDRQVTFQLLHDASGQPYEPQPGEYFSWAFHIDDNNTGYMLLNGVHVQTRSNFFGAQDIGDSFQLGGRGFWKDGLWPTPIYCAYWWIEDRGSTIPTRTQLQQLHDDPWGPFRHYREELHTNVYPMQRNYSQRFVPTWPARPDAAPVGYRSTFWEKINQYSVGLWSDWTGIGDGSQTNEDYPDFFKDYSGNNYHLTLENNFALPERVKSEVGFGQLFDGGGGNRCRAQRTAVEGPFKFNPDTPFTIAVLLRLDGEITGRERFEVTRSGAGFPTIYLGIDPSSGQLAFSKRPNASTDWLILGPTPEIGKLYLLVGEWTGTYARFWVNGELIASQVDSVTTGEGLFDEVYSGDHNLASNHIFSVFAAYVWQTSNDNISRSLMTDPFGPIRHYRDTQPVQILAPQLPSHLSVIVTSTVPGNSIVISPVPSNGSFMTIS